MYRKIVLGFLAIIGSVHALLPVVTVTRTVTSTLTQTMVALGGVLQNIDVNLNNGNGHVWIYNTAFATGERMVTVYNSLVSGCATMYIYGADMLTIETPASSTSTSNTPARKGFTPTPTNAVCLGMVEGQTPFDEDKIKISAIIKRIMMDSEDMDHIRLPSESSHLGSFETIISI